MQNSCKQMQTELDLNFRAMFMFGLISKNYPFVAKLILFYKQWPIVMFRIFRVSNVV